MDKGWYTYTSGFDVHKDQVTKGDIVQLCDTLEKIFGVGYTFRPEPITEGGIEMTNWPGRISNSEHYKAFRFRIGGSSERHGKWPHIDEKSYQNWKQSNVETDVVFKNFTRKYERISLLYKAFYGAPVWTHEQEQKLAHAFKQCGFKCINLSRATPANRDKALKEYGDLGSNKI
jgi:hypothetical protein